MTRTMNKWFLASVPTMLMVSSLAISGCQNDKVAKDDVEAIVNARLADEEAKRIAAEHAVLKEENAALKEEVATLKEELAAAEAKLKPSGKATASAATSAKKPVAQASKQKQMAALKEKLRGGSGGK